MVKILKIIIKYCFKSIQSFINSISFQVKLIILTILSISIFITLSAFFIIQNIQSNIDQQVFKLNQNLKTTQILSQISSYALIKDYLSIELRKAKLKELLSNFINEYPGVSYAVLTDNFGNILGKSNGADITELTQENPKIISPPTHVPFIKISHSNGIKILNIAEPIEYNSNYLGWAWVGMPDTGFTIVGSKKELIVFLLEIFLLVWVLSVIGAIVNSLIITRPLKKLEKGAKAITEGRFGFQLPLKGFLGRELSQLVKAFNKMSKRLQQYEESNLASLSSERNKFESVVMSIADGVMVLDKQGTIQIVNLASRRLLNRSGDELIGQKYTNIWNEKVNEQVFVYLNSINSNSISHVTEYANFEIERENKKLKLIVTPLHDSNNETQGAVIVIQDRTKEAEIELMKQEFISNVSHELRTPITSIKCYVDTLCSHNNQIDEGTKSEFLSIVNEETDRLSNLVNDVLELSRLESPAAKLQLTIQDIYPSIEYSFRSVGVLAEKKSIKLIKDVEENLPMLNINQENMERILVNLISNAIKYTPANGTVQLSVHKKQDSIVFKVIDNGIGIEEEDLPFIFERFYRVENKVHTIKGTGLGLTIVKKSVEQLGGKISVKSNPSQGTTFEFSLPIPKEPQPRITTQDFQKETQIAKSA